MSIFNKKKVAENSADYKKYMELYSLLTEIDFIPVIKELCTVKTTLDFYEKKSPDWEAEMTFYKNCRKTLLCLIGVYDSTRRDIIEILDNSNAEDLKGFRYPIPSHEKIRRITKIITKIV